MIVDWSRYGSWEAVQQDLPDYLSDAYCQCPGGIKTKELTGAPGKSWLTVCKTCLKPSVHVLVKFLIECYECERLYIPNVWPDKFLLCARCGGD